MAQVVDSTPYGEMQVGDTLPDGRAITGIDHETSSEGKPLIRLTVFSHTNYRNEPVDRTYAAQYADLTYGESVAHAEFMRDNLAYGD